MSVDVAIDARGIDAGPTVCRIDRQLVCDDRCEEGRRQQR